MNISLCSAIVLLLFLFSCDHHHHDHSTHETVASAHDLKTDGGKKWQMDDHTRSMFAAMGQKTAEYSGDPKQLGQALQGDLEKLIQGCTMTGDAHNELHKYLVLYMPAVQQLSESGSPDQLTKIKELLAVYPQYFE